MKFQKAQSIIEFKFILEVIKRCIFPLFLTSIIISCSIKNSLDKMKSEHYPPTPVGTIEIDSNLFIDYTEITNVSYLEYLVWIKRIYGENSRQFNEAYPDTSVWVKQDTSLRSDAEYYVNHIAYRQYPVVGISYNQACNFSNWRSDRVFESLLIKQKMIEAFKQDSNTVFTIKKYYSGNYFGIQPDFSIQYPFYGLPSKNEWFIALNFTLGLNQKNITKCKKRYCEEFFSDGEHIINSVENNVVFNGRTVQSTLPAYCSLCRKHIIYHLKGNVRELSNIATISFGGGWTDSLEVIENQNEYEFNKPNAFTGFRNVCRWKSYEKPKL